jgi:hypothetical protein
MAESGSEILWQKEQSQFNNFNTVNTGAFFLLLLSDFFAASNLPGIIGSSYSYSLTGNRLINLITNKTLTILLYGLIITLRQEGRNI